MMLWFDLVLFMLAVGLLALYGLAFSGHFPAEFRNPKLNRGGGAMMLWATLAAAGLAAIAVFAVALHALPWSAIIIGGGGMLLAAPLLLRPFPDRFVDGLSGLVAFAAGALVIAVALWAVG